MKDIVILGSTGSVGKNALDVIRRYPDRFRVKAIAAKDDVSLLAQQAKEFLPDFVAIGSESRRFELKKAVSGKTEILSGTESFEKLAGEITSDIVILAIPGRAALKPLIAALSNGRTIALASKEPIVSAGPIIAKLRKKNNSRILPVDSEHSAIMQCLGGQSASGVRRLYITGSGGSLKDRKNFDNVSLAEVLKHPKWVMGRKITVDSATLMNKGLEVIEARWLFDIPQEKIKVIIHPEAIIHSMVEFMDGTIQAGLFYPDMRFPILKALSFPEVLQNDFPKLDFSVIKGLSFSEPDMDKFPALGLALGALERGGTMPAVLNSSNEKAVDLFLKGKIAFSDITRIIEKVMASHTPVIEPLLEDIIDAEKWAAEEVMEVC